MTAAEQCKAAGLKSLAELAAMVRKPSQTLRNWHRDSPELFAVVVAGAALQRVPLECNSLKQSALNENKAVDCFDIGLTHKTSLVEKSNVKVSSSPATKIETEK